MIFILMLLNYQREGRPQARSHKFIKNTHILFVAIENIMVGDCFSKEEKIKKCEVVKD